MTSRSGVVDVAKEIGDAVAVLAGLAREGEAAEFGGAVLVEYDQVVALAGGFPVAVSGLGAEDAVVLAELSACGA